MLRIISLLVASTVLVLGWYTYAQNTPPVLTPEELADYRERARIALEKQDEKALDAIGDELHIRLTGQKPFNGKYDPSLGPPDPPILPGLCNLQKAEVEIFPNDFSPFQITILE